MRVDTFCYYRLLRNIFGNSSTFAYHMVLESVHVVMALVALGRVSQTPTFFGSPAYDAPPTLTRSLP